MRLRTPTYTLFLPAFIAAASFLLLTNCAKPPLEEIASAEAALEKAREAEAPVYAPETFKSAEDMLARAKDDMDKKKYGSSRESAIQAKDLADQAADEASRKKAAKGESAKPGLTAEEMAAGPQMTTAEISVAELEEQKVGTGALEEGVKISSLEPIRFDFDDFSLNEEAKEILARNAAWLKKYVNVTIQVEGHCDERGSNEYNIALGERRAKSAQDYLVFLGVERERLSTISYGEEVPLDPGHNEDAWVKNRRAEFVVQTK